MIWSYLILGVGVITMTFWPQMSNKWPIVNIIWWWDLHRPPRKR